MAIRQSIFSIDLEYDEARVFYTGAKNRVQVTANDGKKINLPWSMLQPFFTPSGVQGQFVIQYTEKGFMLELNRLKQYQSVTTPLSKPLNSALSPSQGF